MAGSNRGKDALKLLLVFMLGLYSLAAQTLLFRAFLSIFDGSEIGIGVFFGSWLIWVVIGAFFCRFLLVAFPKIHKLFELLILIYLPAFLLQLYMIEHARAIAGVAAYEAFPLLRMLATAALVNGPTSLLTGMLFPLACRWISRGRDESAAPARLQVATVYIFEALGACAGGVATTLLLWLGMPDTSIFCYTALALSISSCLYRSFSRRKHLLAILPVLIAVVVATGIDRDWNEYRNRNAWSRLMPAEDYLGSFTTAQTPYRYGYGDGQFNLLAWGSIAESIPQNEYAGEVVALSLAQHPRASHILVLGTGSYSICRAFAHLPSVAKISWLTADPLYTSTLKDVLPARMKKASDKIFTPPREIRNHLGSDSETYDLVIINLPDPDTLLLNRYFTTEFYELLKKRMRTDGVVAVRTSGNENFIGGEMARMGASVYATLRDNFDRIAIKPGDDSWLLASNGEGLTQAPGRLRNRFRGIPGATEIYPPEGVRSLYRRNRAHYQRQLYEETLDASASRELINSDRHPKALLNTLLLSLRRHSADSNLFQQVILFSRYGFVWILILLGLYTAFKAATRPGNHAPIWDNAFLVCSTGLAALTVSVVLMFVFQSRFGSIYLFVGMLSSLFMLGLFAGGALCRRLLLQQLPAHKTLPAGLTAHAALCLALYPLARWLPYSQFIWLFLISGAISGIYIPVAAHRLENARIDSGKSGSIIDACDHLGGAIGALVTGLALLPLFGTLKTLLLICALLLTNLPAAIKRGTGGTQAADLYGRLSKHVGNLLLFVGFAFLMISDTIQVFEDRSASAEIRLEHYAERWLPSARVSELEWDGKKSIVCYRHDESGDVVLQTGKLTEDIRGYNGPIAMALMVSSRGAISEIEVARHRETPYYMRMLDDWISKLRGENIFEPSLESRVDAVSGATATSRAILSGLARTGRLLRSGDSAGSDPGDVSTKIGVDRGVLLLLALLALALWIRSNPRVWLRRAYLVAVVLLLGLWCNAQYSSQNGLNLLGMRLPTPGLTTGFVLTIGIPLAVLLFGNVYCGYLCPFGALQELLGDLAPKTMRLSPHKNFWRWTRSIKYVVLFLFVLFFCFDRQFMTAAFDPLLSVFARPYAIIATAALAILLSLLFKRFWCRNLCPAGAFLALANRIRLLRPKRWRVRPGHCHLGVRTAADIDCIHCDRCRMPDSSRPQTSRRAGRALALALAIFLAFWLHAFIGDRTKHEPGESVRQAATPPAQTKAEITGKTREVDLEKLMEKIRSKELSDKEALYYQKLHKD